MINEKTQDDLLKEAYEDYSKRCKEIAIESVPYAEFAPSVVTYPEFAKACGVSVYTRKQDDKIYMGIHYTMGKPQNLCLNPQQNYRCKKIEETKNNKGERHEHRIHLRHTAV